MAIHAPNEMTVDSLGAIQDVNQQMPVGTTVALLERGSRVMSAIHKRLHYAMKQEFKILIKM